MIDNNELKKEICDLVNSIDDHKLLIYIANLVIYCKNKYLGCEIEYH